MALWPLTELIGYFKDGVTRALTIRGEVTQVGGIVSEEIILNLSQLEGKDYATQATLLALNTAFGAEDFSSEATLSAILAKITTAPSTEAKQDLIKVVLDSLAGKDYATQFTLSALNTAFGAEDFASQTTLASVLSKLTDLAGKDYATQTTLAALNTAFGIEDFSSEITLASVLTKLTELDNKIDAISNVDNMKVSQVESIVVEQLEETDAVVGVLTFSANVESIEIYHDEVSPQVFIINGLTIKVASGGWRSPIGGIPSAGVTIPAGITCLVTRLV